MKTPISISKMALLAGCLTMQVALYDATAAACLTTVASSSVTAYDFSTKANRTHVVYESGGSVYYTSQSFNSTTWDAPQLIGAGTRPSIAISGGTAHVSYVSSGNLTVASLSAGVWTPTNLGTANGVTSATLRADGAGTLHLLSNGHGTTGRGSIDYASNSGSGWTAVSNLAFGWYDSGRGNYYHQATLATTASGYSYLFEAQNWGGRVSWSSKNISSAGLTGWPYPGTDWNTALTIGTGGLSIATDGHAMAGYLIGPTGYVKSYNGTSWAETSLGSASDVMVLSDAAGGDFAYYVSGGILKKSMEGVLSDVIINGATVSGSKPFFEYVDAQKSALLYIDSTTSNLMAYTIPEPGSLLLIAISLGTLASVRRRRIVQKSFAK